MILNSTEWGLEHISDSIYQYLLKHKSQMEYIIYYFSDFIAVYQKQLRFVYQVIASEQYGSQMRPIANKLELKYNEYTFNIDDDGETNVYILGFYTDASEEEIKYSSGVTGEGAIMLRTLDGIPYSEEGAKAKLIEWLGGLGTWVDGKDNELIFDDEYTVDGDFYYQFRLRGIVDNHATTLTYYVIATDGSDMFEGTCSSGYLNRY